MSLTNIFPGIMSIWFALQSCAFLFGCYIMYLYLAAEMSKKVERNLNIECSNIEKNNRELCICVAMHILVQLGTDIWVLSLTISHSPGML